MKALILTFGAFDNKQKTKSYFKFSFWDIEGKAMYDIFTEQQYMEIPDGVIPTPEEIKKEFPKIAEIDFKIQQYTTKEGKIAYAPRVDAIHSWKKYEIKG